MILNPHTIDDGPPCPRCGGVVWRLNITSGPAVSRGNTLVVEMVATDVTCGQCGHVVPLGETPDAMRWTPDPLEGSGDAVV